METASPKASSSSDWLVGNGELVSRIRGYDWAGTSLGPVEGWPESLRTAVGMLLSSRAQICIFWGPDRVVLYNDAYAPVLGGKHGWALGRPGREVWSEIWEAQLGPLLQGVVDTGESFWASALLFCLQRHGYLEETYFDISYDPVRDTAGNVAGIYCIVTEMTGRVVGERRLRALSGLGRVGLNARGVSDVLENAANALAQDPEDIAFALLYEWDAEKGMARLRGRTGIASDHPAALAEVTPGIDGPWPIGTALAKEGVVIEAPSARDSMPLPGGNWPEACSRVAVLPIALPSQAPGAFIVAGLSPRRAADEAYREFLQLIAASIGSSLASVKALETERKRGQALAELDRAKTAFFSNISHEFRTPLTLLLGPLREELVRGADVPAETRRVMDVSYRNGLRLLKLVNALLDFSRIEAGRMSARFEPTDLAHFTAELASNFESAFARAGLRLRIDCPPLAAPAYVDRDMWEKVVLNLLSNAFKYTFEGGVDVSLGTRDGRAVLAIRDTGVGIPASAMPRLFERFHRIEGTRARTHEGSGIGLALVNELVRMHGGEIHVESREGEGTAFEVELPLGCEHLPPGQVTAPAAAEPSGQAPVFVQELMGWLREPPPESGSPPSLASRGRERILVAEDNADMREYIERLLGEHWEVVTVPDGQAAMHALFTARFDLVLTDVMMPRMDGFALLKAVRSDESVRDIPVVMLSARAGEEARIEGRDAGADDYLVKPFSARELVAQVRAQLALARARRATAREREMLLANERAARMDAERQWEDLIRLFEQAPNPMVILRGRQNVIELANPAACNVWGRSSEQVLHKPLFDALPEIRGQGLEELLADVLDNGAPIGGQVAIDLDRGAGMETVHFDFLYSPLRATSGRIEGVAVTAFDITKQVRGNRRLAAEAAN
jgi:PAS domain S-box-containing protein